MKKSTAQNITINAMGIALFVVLSMCIRVPVFQNYYLCLGYVAMTFYCYSIGTKEGTFIGTVGVIIYCVLTSGLRGMPGWATGNLVLGCIMGVTFKYVRKLKKPMLETMIASIVIIIGTAIAMLVVKSGIEYLIYYEPFLLRGANNVYAFVADAFVIIISLPICRILEPKILQIVKK